MGNERTRPLQKNVRSMVSHPTQKRFVESQELSAASNLETPRFAFDPPSKPHPLPGHCDHWSCAGRRREDLHRR